MTRKPSRLIAFLSLIFAGLTKASGFEPSEDGLYAVFDTSEGKFTAELYFEKAPVTVANFVGLAENSISHFTQAPFAAQNQPFYDNTVFHRIVKDFVIQGGSPDRTGTDGPGYSFADEIDPGLSHDKNGVLSMANAGPNSNGSQFFITYSSNLELSPPPTFLDGGHTIFGQVVDGIEIVGTINSLVDNNGSITKDTVINSVTILRKGPAAEAFKPASLMRPFEVDVDPAIEIAANGAAMVSFSRSERRDYFLYRTSNFREIEGPIRLLWTEEAPEIIEHDIELNEINGTPIFYYYSELALPWAESNPGAKISFTLPEDRGFGLHTVSLGEDLTGTFTSVFNPEESFECNYQWYDLGDSVQIYFFFPFQVSYEVQIYLKKKDLNGTEAFMRLTEPRFLPDGRPNENPSFNHIGAFTFTPAP